MPELKGIGSEIRSKATNNLTQTMSFKSRSSRTAFWKMLSYGWSLTHPVQRSPEIRSPEINRKVVSPVRGENRNRGSGQGNAKGNLRCKLDKNQIGLSESRRGTLRRKTGVEQTSDLCGGNLCRSVNPIRRPLDRWRGEKSPGVHAGEDVKLIML